jgi:hypothetical protein
MSKFSRMLAVIVAVIIGLGMSAGVVAQNTDTDNVSITVFSGALTVETTVTGFGNITAGQTSQGTITMAVIDGRITATPWYVAAKIDEFVSVGSAPNFVRSLPWAVNSAPAGVDVSNLEIDASSSTVLTAPLGGTRTVTGIGSVDVPQSAAPDTYVATLTTTITAGDPG